MTMVLIGLSGYKTDVSLLEYEKDDSTLGHCNGI